jgi:SHS family lactate transporter-like MFS transporter
MRGGMVASTFFDQARGLTRDQRNAFIASFLGWTMDAFDYFLIVFVFAQVAQDLNASLAQVTVATTLTLAARPVGALLFGLLADRFGRRTPLMLDVLFYSIVEFLTGFSPNLTALLVLRTLYGIGMGGEWGLGASLAMEKVPSSKRGFFSGLLQQGYAFGYLLAALAFYVVGKNLGWRWMFFLGSVPALLVLYIRYRVGESEVWETVARQHRNTSIAQVFFNRSVLLRFGFLILLMTAFNFMSHGTQDLYPTFLTQQHGASADTAVVIAVIYNIGALIGGVIMGALSEPFGRRRIVVICAVLALIDLPLFAFAPTFAMLALGAFIMQFLVQGAWGVIPAHLSELSPDEIRGFYPGVTYQLGNLLASVNLPLQTLIAVQNGNDFARGIAFVTAPVLVAVIVLALLSPENRGVEFGRLSPEAPGTTLQRPRARAA